ncbi:isochorismatase family protein [Bosea sp. R86505]|uniref:isochorismatase family protein n=1 Tax=Bosea sp. R86505 TaxID=3101710 RepID=UPI003673390F
MNWTRESIAAMAASRGFDKLEPEHLDRWLALAQRQPSTLPLRTAVERKQDEPAYGPQAFAPSAVSPPESAAENYRGVFNNRLGFGRRPAVIAIDFVRSYTTPGALLYAEGVVRAVAQTEVLFAQARRLSVPILHTRPIYHPSGRDGGLFVQKVPALRAMVRGEPLAEFDPAVAPLAEEIVFEKAYPSSFFGTALAPTLTAQGIDTVILVGCSTSGCVRATAVDALQYGFRPIVARECVGDRHPGPHDAALFDIDAKYGDVEDLATILAFLTPTEREDTAPSGSPGNR